MSTTNRERSNLRDYVRVAKFKASILIKRYLLTPIRLFILRKRRELKLHLGCGSQHLDGYVNIDSSPTPAADIVLSAEKLPFKDGQVAEIFTSHMIEHIPRESLKNTLKEWHRVLQKGGKLVVRCPNFELYIREWLEGDYDWRWGWGLKPIFGHEGRGKGMWHLNGFTVERLDRLFSENGFKTVSCTTTETRAFTINTFEYRQDGDILYTGEKTE